MNELATVERLRAELAVELAAVEERIRTHPFVAAFEAGRASLESLHPFVAEQREILRSDNGSFVRLAERFPHEPAGSFFRSMAVGELEALDHLERLAAALGPAARREPRAAAQAYPSFVARLALPGSRLDVALAFLVNLDAWGASCVRLGHALRERHGLDGEATGFFDFFAPPGPDERERFAAVGAAGLAAGDDPEQGRRSARLLQAYELLFWDSLVEDGWSG